MSSHDLLRDTRGTTAAEYALLLFAVLLGGASAVRAIGPKVTLDGSVTARILGGEDIRMNGVTGSVIGGASGLRTGTSGEGSSSNANGASTPLGGGSQTGAASPRENGLSSLGGGVVLGASGAPDLGSFSTDAYSGGSPSSPSGGSGSSSSSSSSSFTPHFTSALFQNPAYHGPSSSGSTPGSSSAEVRVSTPSSSSSSTFTPHFTSALFQNPAYHAPSSHAPSHPTVAHAAPASHASSSSNGGYTISAKGRAQMASLLSEAKSQADGNRPEGRCYAAVATYIDAVGYGNMGKAPGASLPSVPDDYGTYAHQFADYMNAKGKNGQTNASRLGLQRLPITNPYKAPPGSIVVVRAGTPGTANPVAGDIVVVGKNGTFYNDGNMGYGGSQNFPAGNTYVLGIYAPK